MTGAMIYDKKRASKFTKIANNRKVDSVNWKAPTVEDISK
jgi:hypothetical protein